jgi:Mg2+-importing ATPase
VPGHPSPSAAVQADATRTGRDGLSSADAARRLVAYGPNAVRTHRARALLVLGRQFRSPLLVLLLVTAGASYWLGQRTDAVIIAIIVAASVGLGFVNEYRAEKASEAMHSRIQHLALVVRDGQPQQVSVVDLVPGDLVHLSLGSVVPADLQLVEATDLECDEGVLTGEARPTAKIVTPAGANAAADDSPGIAWMGTVVHAGSGVGVVVATGARTQFGSIAAGLGDTQPETAFQAGLRRFSMLLLVVAGVLSGLILVANLLLRRPFLDSVLFALAIAVGITPQLLPAVVTTSLATGARSLARRKVLVKRLVCIEDLGDLDILVTDKTGTLTEGVLGFVAAVDTEGADDAHVLELGAWAADVETSDGQVVGGNPVDVTVWSAHHSDGPSPRRLGELPFDHDRRMSSVVVQHADGTRTLIVKGAAESVLAACSAVPEVARATLRDLYADGRRVVAVAHRAAPGLVAPTTSDEHDLVLAGYLVFGDPAKTSAEQSLHRLDSLGITVKVATGDSAQVATLLCTSLGLDPGTVLTGSDVDAMDDTELASAVLTSNLFARVSPAQKGRIVRSLRQQGRSVGFLGDGVNDALALHHADVGISVDTATDVAKDAADIVLLEKSLDVLADGVAEGRRIFANTTKYLLMGTSSNFGNMFSAAAASTFLSFLPMLPSQILLNNLMYDAGQMTIPTDRVDPEQLVAPAHWDIAFIRRFMLFFGPLSSMFDFVTFALMLWVLHAGPDLFRSGWFVESLATQLLVIFAIRTRRIPFWRSRPSVPLAAASIALVLVAAMLPLSPLAPVLGFAAPPPAFYAALAAMVVAYLGLVEAGKRIFFRTRAVRAPSPRRRGQAHRVNRRASRFSTAAGRPGRSVLRRGVATVRS